MDYNIVIQARNGFPIDTWAADAYYAFRERQAHILFFEDIHQVPMRKDTILIADIPSTNAWLEAMGGEKKKAINIPSELCYDTPGRWIDRCTLKKFLAEKPAEFFPVFIKPAKYAKEFMAGVVSSKQSFNFFYQDLPDNTWIFVSEVVDMVSEYRCYVSKGELLGIKHYAGDFRIFPDTKFIDKCISRYKSAPAGYTIDFAVLKDGRTVLVEVNDGFAIGNYGLDKSSYVSLLCARWLEILKELPAFPRFSTSEWFKLLPTK